MNVVIQDILVYLVYLTIVIIVAHGNRDPNSFFMKDNLQTTLVHGGLLCGRTADEEPCKEEDLPTWHNPFSGKEEPNPYVDFMKVREVNHWWLWLNTTLIPNVRVQNWYNGAPPYGLRGYLDDRVNRIIGYALVRQVREKHGTCISPKLMRDYVDSCTGDMIIPVYSEDDKYYCMGWKPLISENCTRMTEYEFKSEAERESRTMKADYNTYSGGGYELKMKGHIDKLKEKLVTLQNNSWIDNRTRALITEFSVYNAQVNMFGVVKIVAEFVGGGVTPWARIDVIRLTRNWDLAGYCVFTCEVLFILSTFYYILNTIGLMKSVGCSEFFNDSWNLVDILTIYLSVQTVALWALKAYVVMLMTKKIGETRGNEYIPIETSQMVNKFYDYTVSLTVFTSMLKLCRLLSFQKAFRQIAATIKLCFIGLSTFVVEFVIVFGSFCCFFFFVLSAELRNFFDFTHTVENTIAMSIGKFNFSSLRAASEMAAWIFFVFSIVVNMILINMMMAIINMAFEDIKSQADAYKNKFEIVQYIKRSIRELTGTEPAMRDIPRYREVGADGIELTNGNHDHEDSEEKSLPVEFSDKTNQLLDYIEKTYLKGMVKNDREGKNIMDKMRLAENSQKAKAMEYGFDNIFAEGPTPTPSAIAGNHGEVPDLTEQEVEAFDDLAIEDHEVIDGVSMSNVDGMNV